MVTTVLDEQDTPSVASSANPPSFDYQTSRDLEQIAVADEFLNKAWRSLTPPAKRSVELCGLVLEIAAMRGALAGERRRLEQEAGL